MKQYTGTKTVLATPMTRGDYNEYRGWAIPADESPADAGYLIEYTDGGKANDSRHVGYISWSPADVFERAYKEDAPMDFRDRVRAEKTELDEKLAKLDAFGRTPLFASLPADEQGRLNRQHSLMEQYSAVLGERIAAFTVTMAGLLLARLKRLTTEVRRPQQRR